MPKEIRRVAILPLAAVRPESLAGEGSESLDDVLRTTVLKVASFEAVPVGRDRLRQATGRFAWTGTEALPADFLQYFREVEGCQAVLFSEVTAFDPYGPMVLGLRFRLVDSATGEILWMAEKVFDAADRHVAARAMRFERTQPKTHRLLNDGWRALRSPRLFGEYAMITLLASMPES